MPLHALLREVRLDDVEHSKRFLPHSPTCRILTFFETLGILKSEAAKSCISSSSGADREAEKQRPGKDNPTEIKQQAGRLSIRHLSDKS